MLFGPDYHLGYELAFTALVTIICLSYVVIMPVTLQMLVYSCSIIYIGAHHSISLIWNLDIPGIEDEDDKKDGDADDKDGEGEGSPTAVKKDGEEEEPEQEEAEPEHFMSSGDAMMFPLFGSIALCTLYVAFKFFGKDWVNWLLSFYLSMGGWIATGQTATVILEALLPRGLRAMEKKVRVPNNVVTRFFFDEKELADPEASVFVLTVPNVLAYILGAVNCGLFLWFKHFVPHNILGVCFCIQAV